MESFKVVWRREKGGFDLLFSVLMHRRNSFAFSLCFPKLVMIKVLSVEVEKKIPRP